MRVSTSTAALAAVIPLALAQTSTDCNPTEKTCPADTGLDSSTFYSDFTTGSSSNTSWSAATGTTLTYGTKGMEFTIDKAGEAPTVSSDFYVFFGRIEVKMQAALGTGIVSSIVLESDDLDEIDWEFLGGDTTQVETNFFGKGNTTSYDRAIYYDVTTPQAEFHTYTVDWTAERINWEIDGTVVRTLEYSSALALEGKNYPQTPMRVKMGNWCGGCSGEAAGTIEWAGGNTTFDDAPYIMYVESVSIQNYNPAEEYKYGDETGDWESIEIINGTTTASAVGSAASTAATVAATSGASSATATTGTASAPTSSVSVKAISGQTVAVVATTATGSSYSMNTASASAQNSNGTAATGSSSNSTVSSSSSASGASYQTSTSGASANSIMAVSSLLSIALCFLVL